MVHDVLAHHQSASIREIGGAPAGLSTHRRQSTTVDVEPGHLLGQGFGDDVDLDVKVVEEIAQTVDPARSQQE